MVVQKRTRICELYTVLLPPMAMHAMRDPTRPATGTMSCAPHSVTFVYCTDSYGIKEKTRPLLGGGAGTRRHGRRGPGGGRERATAREPRCENGMEKLDATLEGLSCLESGTGRHSGDGATDERK